MYDCEVVTSFRGPRTRKTSCFVVCFYVLSTQRQDRQQVWFAAEYSFVPVCIMCKRTTCLHLFTLVSSARATGGRLVLSLRVGLVTFPAIMWLRWTRSKLRSEYSLFYFFKWAHRLISRVDVLNTWELISPVLLTVAQRHERWSNKYLKDY